MGIHPGLATGDIEAFDPSPAPDDGRQCTDAQQTQHSGEDELKQTLLEVAQIEIVQSCKAQQECHQCGNNAVAGLFVIQAVDGTAAPRTFFVLIVDLSAAMGAVAGTVSSGKAAVVAGLGFFPQFFAAVLTIHECSSYGLFTRKIYHIFEGMSTEISVFSPESCEQIVNFAESPPARYGFTVFGRNCECLRKGGKI